MKPAMKSLGLRARLILAAVALIVLLTTVLSLLVVYQVRRSLDAEVKKRARTMAKELGAMARFPLRTGDRAALERLAREALLFEDVVSIRFTGADGVVMAEEGAVDPQSSRVVESSCPVVRKSGAFQDKTDFYTGLGDDKSGEVLGAVEVRLSLASNDRIIGGIRLTIFIAAALLAGLSILASIHFARRITDPIARLAEGVEAIGRGRLDLEIEVGDDGEIGALAEHVNQMARDLKTSMDQMIQQEKMATLGRMASYVAHEIGSPLNSILIDAHLVMDQLEEGDGKKSAEAIVEQSRRMRDTVTNLLDYARNPAEEMEAVELAKAVEDAIMVLAHPIRKSGICIETSFLDKLPPARAIGNLATQVFVNIIANAIEATGQGGELVIEGAAVHGGDRVRVSFIDNGPGVPDESLARIFDPFYTTKDPGEGTGLGLSICQHIMQGFRGSVSAKGAPRGGSVFIVEFQAVGKQSD